MTPTDPTQQVDPRTLMPPRLPLAAGAPPATPPPQVLPRVAPVQAPAPADQRSSVIPMPQVDQPGESMAARTLRDTQEKGSGISRIHNPLLRTLARVGDIAEGTFAPRAEALTPGTEGFHARELARAGNAVAGEREGAKQESENTLQRANAAHLGAETNTLIPAQAEHAQAQANAIENPNEKISPENEQKTVETDQGIFQWNPESKRYDISVGKGKGQKEAGTVHTLEDGSMIIARPDGTAVPVTLNGQPIKAPQRATGEHIIERVVNGKPHSIMVDSKGQDVSDLGEKPVPAKEPPDRGQNFIDPATHRMVRVEPGGAVPAGALTAAGENSANSPTAQTRTMAETAPKVLELAARVGQLVDQQASSLGPAASRWSEFMAGKVGTSNPEFTKLRTDVGLLQTALMRMHVGARGGDRMMQHFQDLIDTAKQSPENLKAALGEITEYAKAVASEGGNKNTDTPAPTQNGVGGFKAGDTQTKDGVTYVRDDKGTWTPKK